MKRGQTKDILTPESDRMMKKDKIPANHHANLKMFVRAPKGQKYLHQKNLKKIDPIIKTAIAIRAYNNTTSVLKPDATA